MKVYASENKEEKITISKYLQGQFAEHLGRGIYGGLWVGKDSDIPNVNGIRSDIIEALKKINVPVLRWPGGSFADQYHWRDGIGNYKDRRKIFNNSWGGVVEDNSFGTHEFFELCRQLGCEAYINVNLGSGTVREMADWIEYITAKTGSTMADLRAKNGHPEPWKIKFLGLGNEAWMGGGYMRPDYYADTYRRYQTYVPEYNGDIYKIASGPCDGDFEWTDKVMDIAHNFMNGFSLHHYALTDTFDNKGDAVDFDETEWGSLLYSAKRMDDLINDNLNHMAAHDPEHKVDLIVDEWGTWLEAQKGTNPAFLYQQNTIRDAIVAATTFNIFNKHAKYVKMANIAQMVNVLQAIVLTKDDKMILTPTYFAFDMYKFHQDADLIDAYSNNGSDISYTISRKNNEYIISVCNSSITADEDVTIKFDHKLGAPNYSKILAGKQMNDHNTFEEPENVKEQSYSDYSISNDEINISSKKMSVITIKIPVAE